MKSKLLILFTVLAFSVQAQNNCNCDCDINQYKAISDTLQLDSLFRAEQLTIMNIQKDMIDDSSKDLRSLFDCHALKMEVIYKRMESLKFKIEKP